MANALSTDGTAKVILTGFGAEIANAKHQFPQRYSAGQELQAPFWYLIKVFGPYLEPGMEAPFRDREIRQD